MADEFQPYVGPRPFEREDRQRFFGRERESSELLSRVIAHPAVLLYSQSGAGKTSLLNASLIPLLEKEGFETLPTARVRGLAPKDIPPEKISNLYVFNVLMSWAEGSVDPNLLAEMSIAVFLNSGERIIGREGLPAPRIAIFDQFEELFTFYPERWGDRQDFFDQVSEALEADRLMRIIFVMREDYIAELDPYVSVLPEKLRTRFRLERLREDSALEAVTEPLDGTGYSFADGVPEQLINNLLKVPVETAAGVATVVGEFVEPVQLQVVCQQLWQKLDHSDQKEITLDQLKAFGDVDRALSDFYETAISNVTHETGVNEGVLRRWFEHTLITPSGTRGTVYRGREETGGIPNAAVDRFVDQHVIRGELRGGARWYELTHDRLIEPIIASNQQWMLERSGAEQTRQRLEARAAEWVRSGRPNSGLLDEAELLEARRWLESPNAADVGYSEALFALVQASRAAVEEAAHERERLLFAEQQRRAEAEHARAEEQQQRLQEQARSARRMRLLAAALAAMFLLAIATAGFAVNRSRVATSETTRAQQKEREANAALIAVREEKKRADEQTAIAKREKAAADEQRLLAEESKNEAEKAKQLEATQRKKAEENAKAAREVERYRADAATRAEREKLLIDKDATESKSRGESAERNGELQAAIEEYNAAASDYEELGDRDEQASLLIQIAQLHKERGENNKAEEAYARALEIRKKQGVMFTSIDLNDQGIFYYQIGRYDRAKDLYQQAITARKKEVAEADDTGLAIMYRNLAYLYTANDKDKKPNYPEAVKLCQQALGIQEKVLKPDDENLVQTLIVCASTYRQAGKYVDAEPLYQKLLLSYKPIAESDHPDGGFARRQRSLGSLYINAGKYSEAEPFLIQAARIQETLLYRSPMPANFKPQDLSVTYDEQGLVHYYQGKYAEAEELYERSLDIDRKSEAPKSEEATMLHNLALTYLKEARYAESEQYENRSLALREGSNDLDGIAVSHSVLARVYNAQAKYVEAESLFKRMIEERKEAEGSNHPNVAIDRHYLADFYVSQGRYQQAREIEESVIPTLEQSLGPTNWRTSAALSTMAMIDAVQRKYPEAEELYNRAIKNLQVAFDKEHPEKAEHPEIAISLNGLGTLYITQGRYAEAKDCLDRAQEIQKHMLGPEHPDLAATLNNYGLLYSKQGKYAEAESFYKQALAIREKVFGNEHPSVAETLENYAALLRAMKRETEAATMEERAKTIRAKYPQLGPDN